MYQIIRSEDFVCIQRSSDQCFIPADPANQDYQAYLEWQAAQETNESD